MITIILILVCFMAAAVFSYITYWQADIAFAKSINQSTQRAQVIAGLERASELAPGNMQYGLDTCGLELICTLVFSLYYISLHHHYRK